MQFVRDNKQVVFGLIGMFVGGGCCAFAFLSCCCLGCVGVVFGFVF